MNDKAEGIDNLSVLVGSKVICIYVQVQPIAKYLAPLAVDTFLLNLGVSGEFDPWYLCQGKTTATLHLKPSTWGNQRGARSHQAKFSGAVAGDSTLQDRGVARYLLPLLFSLVSLPFSFFFSTFLSKITKIVILLACCYWFHREHQVV